MVTHISDMPALDLGGGVTRHVMSHDGAMMAVTVDFETGAVGAVHAHPHRQVTCCVSGRFRLTLGEETCEIAAGDTYVCAPDEPHGVTCLQAGRLIDVFTPEREDFLTPAEG